MVGPKIGFVQTNREKVLWVKLQLALSRIREWQADWEPDPGMKKHVTLRKSFHDYLVRQEQKLREDLEDVEVVEVQE